MLGRSAETPANEGPWEAGVLPKDVDSTWTRVELTLSPFHAGRGREKLGITCRRSDSEAMARINVYWVSAAHGYDDLGFHFDGTLALRLWYELPTSLRSQVDDDALGAWETYLDGSDLDGNVGSPRSLNLDGVDRAAYEIGFGGLRYVGIEWSPAIAVEIATAGVDPLVLARELSSVEGDEIARFVRDHPHRVG